MALIRTPFKPDQRDFLAAIRTRHHGLSPLDTSPDVSPPPGKAYDSSGDFTPGTFKPASPKLPTTKEVQRANRVRHSYPTNAFIRRTRDIRSFIISETERLANQDVRSSLGAVSRQELDYMKSGPNCAIRSRMARLGLL
jgi:hypothetical protein